MKSIIIKVLSLILVILISYYIFNDYNNVIKKNIIINKYINNSEMKHDVYGYIKIDKIRLLEVIYDIKSPNNSLLKGLFMYSKNPLIIMGHSGRGKLALFNNLDNLYIGDKIIINVNKNKQTYVIENILTKKKSQEISKNADLILITCDKNDLTQKLEILAKKEANC